jgi:hypothetical protein
MDEFDVKSNSSILLLLIQFDTEDALPLNYRTEERPGPTCVLHN